MKHVTCRTAGHASFVQLKLLSGIGGTDIRARMDLSFTSQLAFAELKFEGDFHPPGHRLARFRGRNPATAFPTWGARGTRSDLPELDGRAVPRSCRRPCSKMLRASSKSSTSMETGSSAPSKWHAMKGTSRPRASVSKRVSGQSDPQTRAILRADVHMILANPRKVADDGRSAPSVEGQEE